MTSILPVRIAPRPRFSDARVRSNDKGDGALETGATNVPARFIREEFWRKRPLTRVVYTRRIENHVPRKPGRLADEKLHLCQA